MLLKITIFNPNQADVCFIQNNLGGGCLRNPSLYFFIVQKLCDLVPFVQDFSLSYKNSKLDLLFNRHIFKNNKCWNFFLRKISDFLRSKNLSWGHASCHDKCCLYRFSKKPKFPNTYLLFRCKDVDTFYF